MLYVLLMFKVICIISGNCVLGPVWAVHIEFKKKKILCTPSGFATRVYEWGAK